MNSAERPLPSRFFLAPMAEVTTPALRRLVRKFSGSVVMYSEMISAGALLARASHNEPLTAKLDSDDPLVYQIVGAKPDVMAGACRILAEKQPFGIDINMGCGAPDIVKTGAGAALLKDHDLARRVVRACRAAAPCRLSVKMRSGFDRHDPAATVTLAKICRDEGADFITLHPRFGKLGFRRSPDWPLVKELREALSVPVIGNGDIKSAETALRRMDETGCDAVMIGRAAAASPWIFRLLEEALAGQSSDFVVPLEDLFLEGLDLIGSYLPERLHKSRGHRFCFYFSGNVKFSHNLYTAIRREETIEGMKRPVIAYFEKNPHERTIILSPAASPSAFLRDSRRV